MKRRASLRNAAGRAKRRLFFERLETRRLLTAEIEPNDTLVSATGFVAPATP